MPYFLAMTVVFSFAASISLSASSRTFATAFEGSMLDPLLLLVLAGAAGAAETFFDGFDSFPGARIAGPPLGCDASGREGGTDRERVDPILVAVSARSGVFLLPISTVSSPIQSESSCSSESTRATTELALLSFASSSLSAPSGSGSLRSSPIFSRIFESSCLDASSALTYSVRSGRGVDIGDAMLSLMFGCTPMLPSGIEPDIMRDGYSNPGRSPGSGY
mmetsp:Transcript_30390/g.68693  ORF Transcript_30390/g.68693 Transcript_30390/m.68693 type:complete len:220 (+) Transcript_30390:195-854(+)